MNSLRHTHMMHRQDEESPSPGALGDDRQEPRVDGAEVVVLDAARDGHAIEAALLGGGLAEHMAELGAPVLRTPCHLQREWGEGRVGVSQGELLPSSALPHKHTEEPQCTLWSDAFFKHEQLRGEIYDQSCR